MSKWLNKKKFAEWDDKKSAEQDDNSENQSFYKKWSNPKMGGVGKPKEYSFRLLPDTDGSGYKGYFYHMFQVGEVWKFFGCPKTQGLDHYCPWCQIAQILYKGTASDKKKAGDYKRKQKYVSNVFIENDPRDADETNEDRKVNGTVRLYEFPPTVEKMFKSEVTDKKNGYGEAIFNPEADGYNFLLKIEAKKPDANQKVWPDYTPSMFSRKPSAIAETEAEIDALMESRISLDEYIKSMELTPADHKKLLREEMVWDDVETEFNRYFSTDTEEKVEPKKDTPKKDDGWIEPVDHSDKKASKVEDKQKEQSEDESDADLLDELDTL